jgi:hypothetical protein
LRRHMAQNDIEERGAERRRAALHRVK